MNYKTSASLQEIKNLRQWLREEFSRMDISEKCRDDYLTAISELASNVVKYPKPPASQFKLQIARDLENLTVEFCCDTQSFSNQQEFFSAAQMGQTSDPTATSGRGLAIVRWLFPRLEYQTCKDDSQIMECYRLSRNSQLCGTP